MQSASALLAKSYVSLYLDTHTLRIYRSLGKMQLEAQLALRCLTSSWEIKYELFDSLSNNASVT